ncbi:transmembrane protein 234 homolog [Cylas formicarius]|uniref:transmembrane protein 234 homolog n=1 Tax=Cylas formicarius TaxID=197179 RepID=UPI0029586E56|nr:transmembrane protein 234 homolog [Cylas formicarius]
MLNEALCLVCVSALWGLTNPIIKRNSKGIKDINCESNIRQFWSELKFLVTNLNYLMPMGINQLGSILYFIALQHIDLTLSVPVANSLTFVFTAISGFFLGECLPRRGTIVGICCVLFGTILCCYDKYIIENP